MPIVGRRPRCPGKAGKYNVGLLNMQTSELETSIAGNNFSVVRVSRDLPNRSQFGGLITQRAGHRRSRRDRRLRPHLRARRPLGHQAEHGRLGLRRRDRDARAGAATTTAFNLRSRTNLQRIDVDAGYQQVGDAFNPEVGFLSRGGYRKPDVRVMTRFRPKRVFQELRPHVTYRGFWGLDGFQETGYTHIDNHWQFKDSTEVHTGINLTLEGVRVPFQIYPGIFVPAGTYDNVEVQPVVMTNQGGR